jgi:hypothetical protein
MIANARCIVAPGFGHRPGKDLAIKDEPFSGSAITGYLAFGEYVNVISTGGNDNQWAALDIGGWVMKSGIGFIAADEAMMYKASKCAADRHIQQRIDDPWQGLGNPLGLRTLGG